MRHPARDGRPLLFHGTKAGFRSGGGLLLPGDTYGRDNHAMGRSHVVYVTPDLDLAWTYADVAQGRGKPKVLIVVPDGPIKVDDSTIAGGEEQESYECQAAFVRAVITDRVWRPPQDGCICGGPETTGSPLPDCPVHGNPFYFYDYLETSTR